MWFGGGFRANEQDVGAKGPALGITFLRGSASWPCGGIKSLVQKSDLIHPKEGVLVA